MRAADDQGNGRWLQILAEAGVPEKSLNGHQHPCPVCGGKDRFRFDNKEGRGTWFCNNCGAGDGYKLLGQLKNLSFPEAVEFVKSNYAHIVRKKAAPEKDYTHMLRRLWSESKSNHPEIIRYLLSRGLGQGVSDRCSAVLRYHPLCPWGAGATGGKAPAMLAKVYQDGKPVTIHRTFLTNDVPERKMLMPHNGKLSGCVIPLITEKTKSAWMVAEGIETALSGWEMFQREDVCLFATVSADHMAKLTLPKHVTHLIVLGDNDESYTGQHAAYTLAKRATKEGIITDVRVPDKPGTDFNDVIN